MSIVWLQLLKYLLSRFLMALSPPCEDDELYSAAKAAPMKSGMKLESVAGERCQCFPEIPRTVA
jgi:hypothetical protein